MSFSRKLKRQLETVATTCLREAVALPERTALDAASLRRRQVRGRTVRRAGYGLALAAVLGASATAPTLAWDDELEVIPGDDLVQLTPDQLDALRGGLSIGPFSLNFAVTITTTINNALSLQTKLTMDIQQKTQQIVSTAVNGAYTPTNNKAATTVASLGQSITASVQKSVAANVPNGAQLAEQIKDDVQTAIGGFLPNPEKPLVTGSEQAGNLPVPSPVQAAPLLDVSPDNIASSSIFAGNGDPITSSVDLASALIDNIGSFGDIVSTVAQLPNDVVNQAAAGGGGLPSGEQIANQVANSGNLPSGEQIANQVANQVVDTLVGSAQNLVPPGDNNPENTGAASEVEVVSLPGGTQFSIGEMTKVLHQLNGGIGSQIQNSASNLDIQQFVELNISLLNFSQVLNSSIQKTLSERFNGELSRFGSTLGN